VGLPTTGKPQKFPPPPKSLGSIVVELLLPPPPLRSHQSQFQVSVNQMFYKLKLQIAQNSRMNQTRSFTHMMISII
jgi:hypothetical protein